MLQVLRTRQPGGNEKKGVGVLPEKIRLKRRVQDFFVGNKNGGPSFPVDGKWSKVKGLLRNYFIWVHAVPRAEPSRDAKREISICHCSRSAGSIKMRPVSSRLSQAINMRAGLPSWAGYILTGIRQASSQPGHSTIFAGAAFFNRPSCFNAATSSCGQSARSSAESISAPSWPMAANGSGSVRTFSNGDGAGLRNRVLISTWAGSAGGLLRFFPWLKAGSRPASF